MPLAPLARAWSARSEAPSSRSHHAVSGCQPATPSACLIRAYDRIVLRRSSIRVVTLVLAAHAAACDDGPCDVFTVVADYAGADSLDCGLLNRQSPAAEFQRAQRCVLDAITETVPFHSVQLLEHFEGTDALAYVGVAQRDRLFVLTIDSLVFGSSNTSRVFRCPQIEARPGCEPAHSSGLCLRCVSQLEFIDSCSSDQFDQGNEIP